MKKDEDYNFMTARRIKSLRHNLEDGIDIPQHREHRSKKNRKFKATSPAFRIYKLKKKGLLD